METDNLDKIDDFISEFFSEKKKVSRGDNDVSEDGFLPNNDEYDETMHSSQEDVEANPRKYIIEECIPACLKLWENNIYTFMVSDNLNYGECWIEVIYDNLSDENKNVFGALDGEDIIKFSYHAGCVNFGVKKVGKDAQKRLLEIASQFKMQDVPEGLAYVSIEDFLIDYCNCYDELPNPNYREMKPFWEMNLSVDDFLDYTKLYDEWLNSNCSMETIRVFNPSKITNRVKELAKEHGFILEGDRVYLGKFHYKKHQNYLESLNDIKRNRL